MGIGVVWLMLGLAYLIGLPIGALVAFFRPARGRRARGLILYGTTVAAVFAVSWWVPWLHAFTWTPLGFTLALLFGGASGSGG